MPAKQPKRGRLWLADGSIVRRRAEYRDHVWSYDFVFDRTADGRKLRLAHDRRRVHPGVPGDRCCARTIATVTAPIRRGTWLGLSGADSGSPTLRPRSDPSGGGCRFDLGSHALTQCDGVAAVVPAPQRPAGRPSHVARGRQSRPSAMSAEGRPRLARRCDRPRRSGRHEVRTAPSPDRASLPAARANVASTAVPRGFLLSTIVSSESDAPPSARVYASRC